MKTKQFTTDFTEVLKTEAFTTPLEIPRPDGEGIPFRFKGIVDAHGTQLGAVTEKYALVQNMTVAKAVADALHDNGIERRDIRRGRARYGNGKTRFDIHLPSEAFSVPGDSSEITPTIQVGNDYRGAGGLNIGQGAFREVCTNGMVAFVVAHALRMRHIGDLSYATIYPQVSEAIQCTLQEAQDQREVAGLLADTAQDQSWVDDLLENTAKRYQPALARALGDNTTELGANSWAVAQAISEVATHDMPSSWAAEQWATHAVQDLVQSINQGVTS